MCDDISEIADNSKGTYTPPRIPARQVCVIGKQLQYKVMDIVVGHMYPHHHGKRADLEVNEDMKGAKIFTRIKSSDIAL